MNPILRNTLAVIACVIFGGVINAGLVSFLGGMVDLPPGVDPNNLEDIKNNIHLYSTNAMLAPFAAHAIGTLSGAFMAARLAVSRHMILAMFIGVFFLLGGLGMVAMIPNTPTWFKLLDLLGAYFPMAFIGGKIGMRSAKMRARSFEDAEILDRA